MTFAVRAWRGPRSRRLQDIENGLDETAAISVYGDSIVGGRPWAGVVARRGTRGGWAEPTVGCGRAARAGVVDATRTRLLTRVLAAVKEARGDVERCAVMTNPESRGDARCRPGRRRAASARRDTGDRRATPVRSGRDSDPDSRGPPGWRPAGSVAECRGAVGTGPRAGAASDSRAGRNTAGGGSRAGAHAGGPQRVSPCHRRP